MAQGCADQLQGLGRPEHDLKGPEHDLRGAGGGMPSRPKPKPNPNRVAPCLHGAIHPGPGIVALAEAPRAKLVSEAGYIALSLHFELGCVAARRVGLGLGLGCRARARVKVQVGVRVRMRDRVRLQVGLRSGLGLESVRVRVRVRVRGSGWAA